MLVKLTPGEVVGVEKARYGPKTERNLSHKAKNRDSTACSLDIHLYWAVKMLIFLLPEQI